MTRDCCLGVLNVRCPGPSNEGRGFFILAVRTGGLAWDWVRVGPSGEGDVEQTIARTIGNHHADFSSLPEALAARFDGGRGVNHCRDLRIIQR